VSVSGSNGSGLVDAMMGMFMWNQTPGGHEKNNGQVAEVVQGQLVDGDESE
jgi:hypothetical protein